MLVFVECRVGIEAMYIRVRWKERVSAQLKHRFF